MIYELALVAKSALGAEEIAALQTLVQDVVKENEGEVLIQDDWGNRTFAQQTSKGIRTGHYLYFLYKANSENNKELNRRLKINESVIKSMIVKLADEEAKLDSVVKAYKTPFSKTYNGSATDDIDEDVEKDRKRFSRRRTCWFTAKNITADWKDPKTYNWLLNEFGKISAARVSGIGRRHQVRANAAIKRARNIGLVSHMSNHFAE